MTAQPWATLTDVKNATGATVDEIALVLAKQSIEALTGLIEEVERIDLSDRDRYWLKLASCFQAVWISAQPDYLERNDVMSASQDGQNATGANRDWLVVGPVARRYLKRLSWRGVRTLEAGRIVKDSTAPAVWSDEWLARLNWKPL